MEIYAGIDKIFRFYNRAGFTIRTIHCDGEFQPLLEKVADELGIVMNYATANEHVPEAERNNRTIQERIRATYHLLPYRALPKVLIRYLAMVSAFQLNLFPAKGGISEYYSPHVILTGQAFD